jgi:hypothetical protein
MVHDVWFYPFSSPEHTKILESSTCRQSRSFNLLHETLDESSLNFNRLTKGCTDPSLQTKRHQRVWIPLWLIFSLWQSIRPHPSIQKFTLLIEERPSSNSTRILKSRPPSTTTPHNVTITTLLAQRRNYTELTLHHSRKLVNFRQSAFPAAVNSFKR